MRLTFLGTCSGTEPVAGYRHCAIAVEHSDGIYWFDAGESCSYTAHLAGLDLPTLRAVFISHAHMDHIGGLPNLLWTLRKLATRSAVHADKLAGRTITVAIPRLDVWEAVRTILSATEGGFKGNFALEPRRIRDGFLYEESGFRVTALHNQHLERPDDGASWLSYSFRFEAGGKSVVFSGDVGGLVDIMPLIPGCDLLLMETGHHQVEAVCRELKESGLSFGMLGFTHHGRSILKDPDAELSKARAILGERVFIARDGMRLDLGGVGAQALPLLR